MKKGVLALFFILSGCAQKAALRPVTAVKPTVVCPLGRNLSLCRVNLHSANIVVVYNRNEKNELFNTATGFVVDEDGLIMTAKHVVAHPSVKTFVMAIDGKTVIIKRVQGVFVSPSHDIAVLKVEHRFKKKIQFRTTEPFTGEPLYTIGFPLTQSAVMLGIILHNRLPYVYGSGEYALESEGLQLSTVNMLPGHSGSPIFDYEGKAIGILIATRTYYSTNSVYTASIASHHCISLLAKVKVALVH